MDNCCDSLLKYMVFIFNFFLFMTGVALIAMGAYIQLAMSDYLNFMDSSYLNSSIVFIVIGVVILIIGFFGCCGACTESHCMMYTFGALLTVVVLVEIGAAIAVYMFKGDAKDVITNNMINGLSNYNTDPDSPYAGVTQTWNIIQADFSCCGVSNYTNWENNSEMKAAESVPDQCCKTIHADCGKGMLEAGADISTINTDGCFAKLEAAIEDNIATVGGIAIGIVILQIVGVLIACMLAGNMRRRYNYV